MSTTTTTNGTPATPRPARRPLQEAARDGHREPLGMPASPPDLAGPLPFALHTSISDTDDPSDVTKALALQPFATGTQPWARMTELDRIRADATLLPPGATPLREAVEPGLHVTLTSGQGWTLYVKRRRRSAVLMVSATTQQLGEAVLERATADALEAPPPARLSTSVGFWQAGTHWPRRRAREFDIVEWPTIRPNYAATVRGALDELMTLAPDRISGRLLLLHGLPGTGKTTLLRAVAHAWQGWCQVDCVLDPERLFGDPSYLTGVMADTEDAEPDEYRLVVLEDCDELIGATAKAGSGQALARLLNLTDGLLGQGARLLVAITTNEPLAKLHPAVVRPGRCLAEIEFGPLPHAEAAAWLGTTTGVPATGATLAELYQLKGYLHKVERAEPAASSSGMYL